MDAHDWDERYAASDLVWSAEPNRFVAEELRRPAARPGAGPGRAARAATRSGWPDAGGTSPPSTSRRSGSTRAGGWPATPRSGWVRADATQWDEPASYDLVVLAYLQLPEAERRTAVQAAYASLRSGGTLLLVAHDSTEPDRGHRWAAGPGRPATRPRTCWPTSPDEEFERPCRRVTGCERPVRRRADRRWTRSCSWSGR